MVLANALAVQARLLLDRVGHVLAVLVAVIGLLDDAAAVAPHHAAGNAYDGAVLGHVFYHNGITAHLDVVSNLDVAEHLGAGAHRDVVAKRRVALAALLARSAERDALVEHAVIAHHGGLADDDAHGVVDEETTP